jgi:hypothetical protein
MHGARHLQLPVVAQSAHQPLAPAAYLRNVYVGMLVPGGGGEGGGEGSDRWATEQAGGLRLERIQLPKKDEIGSFEKVGGVGGERQITIVLPFLCR